MILGTRRDAGVPASVGAPAACFRVGRAHAVLVLVTAGVLAAGSTLAQSAPPSQPAPPEMYDSLRVPHPFPADTRYPVDTLTTRTVAGRPIVTGGSVPRGEPGPGRDTTKVMPFDSELWGEGGGAGMVAPADVRQYFQAGVGGSLLVRREFGRRFGTTLRADYQSIPRANQVQVITVNGLETISLGGNATLFAATIGPSVRLWHRLWAEAGVGVAHLRVADGADIFGVLVDPAAITATRNTTGLAYDGRLAWRFPISDTQAMSLSLGWQGHRAGDSGRTPGYVSFRIGWRFL